MRIDAGPAAVAQAAEGGCDAREDVERPAMAAGSALAAVAVAALRSCGSCVAAQAADAAVSPLAASALGTRAARARRRARREQFVDAFVERLGWRQLDDGHGLLLLCLEDLDDRIHERLGVRLHHRRR
eukprot:7381448-Prymnesium_polylepis.1